MLEQVVNERKESLEEITVRLRLKAMVGAEGFEPPMSQGRLIYSQVQYHSATHPISRVLVTQNPKIFILALELSMFSVRARYSRARSFGSTVGNRTRVSRVTTWRPVCWTTTNMILK
jgi:hypothetical protein